MPRERFLNHGQDLGEPRGREANTPRTPPAATRAFLSPCRQVGAALPRPLRPAPSLAAGDGERVPTPITSSGAMESAAAERSGAEGPALPALPHPPRREPLAQPAPHKCINSSHIMINSSVPVTRGGGRRGGWGEAGRTGRSLLPEFAPGSGLRRRGGRDGCRVRARLPAGARACPA